ncbi:MAG TPA: hypothetical protein VGJ97_05265 [Anaerolineaceae bacterium]
MINPHYQWLIYKQQERELTCKIECNRMIAEAFSQTHPAATWPSRLGSWLTDRLVALAPVKRLHKQSNPLPTGCSACTCG